MYYFESEDGMINHGGDLSPAYLTETLFGRPDMVKPFEKPREDSISAETIYRSSVFQSCSFAAADPSVCGIPPAFSALK